MGWSRGHRFASDLLAGVASVVGDALPRLLTRFATALRAPHKGSVLEGRPLLLRTPGRLELPKGAAVGRGLNAVARAGSRRAQHQSPHLFRRVQRHELRNAAAHRVAQHVHLAASAKELLDHGAVVRRPAGERVRDLALGSADAGVVDEQHWPLGRESVYQRRIPVVHAMVASP
ncbi:hypothetical protein Trco_007614 [Trichoderma cornu-damae]|uniref:Uncharacterized protein n=1 Tax=Trichoderma cornu-damae TaxID=654480 RepID=A0A9P8QK35_9HYPO|nr:hypothetical protein Trco_007614 [Trichoderma cornu-damae]